MIKQKELRIGDYFKDRGGKTLRIDYFEIYLEPNRSKIYQRMYVLGMEVHPLTEYLDYLEPILLTKEWLKDFGFTIGWTPDNLYKKVNKDIDFLILATRNDTFEYIISFRLDISIEIKYVHQLQNLYYDITGEELY